MPDTEKANAGRELLQPLLHLGEEPALVLASSRIMLSWGLLGWLRISQMPMPGLATAQSLFIPHFYLPGSALSTMETAIPKPGIWTPSHMLNIKLRLPRLG